MDSRIHFKLDEDRKLFFNKLLIRNNLKNWKDLQNKFGLSKSMLERYRFGKLTIPSQLYTNMIKNFEDKEKELLNNRILKENKNWGQIKGGKITYTKYKRLFELGRREGLKRIHKKYHFDINMPLSMELCEIIGLFIGDGFTNKYGSHYLIQFVGHQKEEIYYKNTIIPYMYKLFKLKPRIIKEEPNTLRINYYSKDLFSMITERFKIKSGRKSKTVLIPEEIINSKKEFLLSTLRGFYDAEGSIYFDRRKIYIKPYPTIELHLNNPRLIEQINKILKENFLKVYIRDNSSRLFIFGHKEVNKFVDIIGFSNYKHLEKLKGIGRV